jgi:hypothetical protein
MDWVMGEKRDSYCIVLTTNSAATTAFSRATATTAIMLND